MFGRSSRARWGATRVGRTAVALSLMLSASAQAQLAPPRIDGTDNQTGEVALPDIAAIEKGARARASVSFAPPTAPALPNNPPPAARVAEPPGPPPKGGTSVRRLSAPPTPSFVRRSGIYGLDSTAPLGEDGPGPADTAVAGTGDHVVRDGDTMSSICEEYFNDPMCWPRLWASNPHITNPHWIFPGDVVHVGSPTAPSNPPVTATPSGMRLTSNRKGSLESRGVMLRESGFIDRNAFIESGKITGSREEKIMLASGDQAYIGFPAGKPLQAGIRYTIYVAETAQPVKEPTTGEVLGYLVRVYGEVMVDQVAENNVARGTLADLLEPVERGYAVSPRVRVFKKLEPKAATTSLETRVVASFSPSIMLASENFVVLSKGAKDGLAVGNRVFVVRRGTGYRPFMEGWAAHDPRYPKEVVAELWVVEAKDKASVAWVARSTKELRVGEQAELRRGH
ncbi:MAG TPA: LysM domain-containing protein [Polyangia bacterium]